MPRKKANGPSGGGSGPRPGPLKIANGTQPNSVAPAATPPEIDLTKVLPVDVYYDTVNQKLLYSVNQQRAGKHIMASLGITGAVPSNESENENGK